MGGWAGRGRAGGGRAGRAGGGRTGQGAAELGEQGAAEPARGRLGRQERLGRGGGRGGERGGEREEGEGLTGDGDGRATAAAVGPAAGAAELGEGAAAARVGENGRKGGRERYGKGSGGGWAG
jgi:hypothetical protein